MGLDNRLQLLLRAIKYYDLQSPRLFMPNGSGSLYSLNTQEAASRETFAWVQINETDPSFPTTKPSNKDIVNVKNIALDFELPPNPSAAHSVAEQFGEWLSVVFFPGEGAILPIEDTGAGAHIIIPIEAINTRIYGGGEVVNLAVKLFVERYIRQEFYNICSNHGIQMSLGAYDISRLLSAPGTWRPGGTKPNEIDYLLGGYMRRFLPPFDEEDPRRANSEFIRDLIIGLTDEAHQTIQQQNGQRTTGGVGSAQSSQPQHDQQFIKWLNAWTKRNPNANGDRSAYFHRIVCAAFRRMQGVESVIIDHSDIIDDLAGSKYNGRSTQEAQRSLQQARQMSGGSVATKSGKSIQDYIDTLDSLGYSFRLNECGFDIEVNDLKMDPGIYSKICNQMLDHGFINENIVRRVWTELAYDDKYNPIREYLEKCGDEYDGGKYIDQIADHFVINEDILDENGPEIARTWMRKWFIGAVAKALDYKQNVVLVLEGPQDIGKSSLARWLCKDLPSYYTEEHVDLMYKGTDTNIRATNTWIWEVGELGVTTRKQDVEALKAFFTKETVTARKPYAHQDVKIKVLASFVGTINENGGGFLSDPTGNRRYAIIPIKRIDFNYTKLDPSKLWGEAYCAYKNGEESRIVGELARVRDEVNSAYYVTDPFPELMARFFDTGPEFGCMTATNIAIILKQRGVFRNIDRPEMTKIGIALAKMKGVRKRKDPNTKAWYYEGISVKSLGDVAMNTI